jgi:DNA-binding NtrC family response regulator
MGSWFEVLVVSSDTALRDSLANILTELGIEPMFASTLHECGEALPQRRVALILCDRHLADGTHQSL